MLDLTVCLILKDEAKRLPGLLACLPLADIEVVAADTGSSDGTPDLLRQNGIEPMRVDWENDFAAARNHTLRIASRSFLLWLDADDRVSPGFWKDLEGLIQQGAKAHRLTVRSPREDGSCESFKQIRLFPNHRGVRFEGRVHEQLGTSLGRLGLPIVDSPPVIVHEGYADPGERMKKRKRNLELLRLEWGDHPRDSAVVLQYGNALCQNGMPAEGRQAYLSLLGFREAEAAGEAPRDEPLRHFPALIAESYEIENDVGAALTWHRLSWRWCPSYLRSAYRMARHALENGDRTEGLSLLRELVNSVPRIGLVACDNEGVRRNALALAFLMATSRLASGWALPGEADAWLRELLLSGRPPLEPRTVVAFLMARGDWESLESYLACLRPENAEDAAALEDGAEALLLGEQGVALDRLLAALPEAALTPVLLAFAAMRQEARDDGRPQAAFARFLSALKKHPEDPTLAGQFCDLVNRHRMHGEAFAALAAWPQHGPVLAGVMEQLQRLGHGPLALRS